MSIEIILFCCGLFVLGLFIIIAVFRDQLNKYHQSRQRKRLLGRIETLGLVFMYGSIALPAGYVFSQMSNTGRWQSTLFILTWGLFLIVLGFAGLFIVPFYYVQLRTNKLSELLFGLLFLFGFLVTGMGLLLFFNLRH